MTIVHAKLQGRSSSGLSPSNTGSRIVVSPPVSPSSASSGSDNATPETATSTSSTESTSTTTSEASGDHAKKQAAASMDAALDSKHPILKRKRNFVGLPPIFAEAWGALEELEEQELMSNVSDVKTTKAKRKLALQRRGRRKNLLQGVILKSVVPATYRGPRLPLNQDSEAEANAALRSTPTSPGAAPPATPVPTTPHCVTLEFVLKMINAFKDGIDLHYQYAQHIIFHVARHLEHKESIVTDITIPDGARLVVVGDLHGQLDDLLTIFKVANFPSKTNLYLFNGDIVDRGSHSVQLLLIIYALKLVFPTSVYINRGNHEHRLMNARYGFELQVKQLYDEALYELIQTSFNWLPIATLVEESAFIVHGGLTQYDTFSIDELRRIKRRDLLPHPLVQTREEFILEQLLWSDPGRGGSGYINNRRGAGILFSAELTAAFLKKNNLQLILRSHQMVDTGYSRCHGGKLVTIFSASNYCGTNDNLGAIAIFDADSGKLHFMQYDAETNLLAYAPTLEKDSLDPKMVSVPSSASTTSSSGGSSSKASGHVRQKSTTDSQRDETLQKLHERILRKRHTLYMAFVQLDKKSGFVTLNDWAAVMTMVIRIDLHWQALWPFLGYKDEAEEEALAGLKSGDRSSSGSKKRSASAAPVPSSPTNTSNLPEFINYTKFLDTYTTIVDPSMATVLQRKQSQLVDKLCRKFYEKSLDLKQVFDAMDKDGDGRISYEEFVRGLRRFKHALGLDGGQLYDLMRSVDRDQDGLVRWKDFLDRFQLKFEEISQVPEDHKKFLLSAMTELANVIYRKRGTSESAKVKRMFRALAGSTSPLPTSPGHTGGSGSGSDRERSTTPPPRGIVGNDKSSSPRLPLQITNMPRYPARRPSAPSTPTGITPSSSRPALTQHTFTPPQLRTSSENDSSSIPAKSFASAPSSPGGGGVVVPPLHDLPSPTLIDTPPISPSPSVEDVNRSQGSRIKPKRSGSSVEKTAASSIFAGSNNTRGSGAVSDRQLQSIGGDDDDNDSSPVGHKASTMGGSEVSDSTDMIGSGIGALSGRANSTSRLQGRSSDVSARSTDSARSSDSTRSESLKYVSISFKEFQVGIKRQMGHMNWSKAEVRILFNYLDRNADGLLSYFEFRRCFRFQDSRSDKWAGAAIAAEIQNNRNKLLKLFVEMDVEGSGKVPLSDFKTVFNTLLGKALEEEEARVLGQAVEAGPSQGVAQSGHIDYNQFLRSFRAGRKHQHVSIDNVAF